MVDAYFFEILYDTESDFLDIRFADEPEACSVEELEDGVFVRRTSEAGDAVGVWVREFSRRFERLPDVLKMLGVDFPLRVLPAERAP